MVTGVFASVSIETEDMAAFQKLQDLKIPVVFFDRVPELPGYHKAVSYTHLDVYKRQVLTLPGPVPSWQLQKTIHRSNNIPH